MASGEALRPAVLPVHGVRAHRCPKVLVHRCLVDVFVMKMISVFPGIDLYSCAWVLSYCLRFMGTSRWSPPWCPLAAHNFFFLWLVDWVGFLGFVVGSGDVFYLGGIVGRARERSIFGSTPLFNMSSSFLYVVRWIRTVRWITTV